MENKASNGLAVNYSTRRAAVPSLANPRAIHIPRANLCNEPCSMWAMEALSRTDLPSDAEICNFTRGLSIDTEEHELSQRHRTFNVTELARQAAYITQADRCVSIREYADGMYNRVLLLSTNNGKEVVAKIPNPDSGQPHFTTASEVATMKFVSILLESFAANSHICQAREELRTPLPEVYAWSSRAHETPVGAEFILMEKMNCVELETVLPRMKIQDRLEVVKAVAGYQKSWASVSFKQFGSLYCEKLPPPGASHFLKKPSVLSLFDALFWILHTGPVQTVFTGRLLYRTPVMETPLCYEYSLKSQQQRLEE
jgi:hypothetical protein